MRRRDRLTTTGGATTPLLAILVGALLIVIVALISAGHPAWALPTAMLAGLLAVIGFADALGTRRALRAHGASRRRVAEDEAERVPPLVPDPRVPLGASEQSPTD